MEMSDQKSLWGLSLRELHDAHWKSRGVQVVVLNSEAAVDPDAELYLLLRLNEYVGFDIVATAETMVWSRAEVLRIAVVDDGRRYAEKVVRDEHGAVVNIRREYPRRGLEMSTVYVSTSRSLAMRWSESSSASTASRLNLSGKGPLRLAKLRLHGRAFDPESDESSTGYLNWLVGSWFDPDRVIEGIAEIEAGVFGRSGVITSEKKTFVNRIWVGDADESQYARVLVGPGHVQDLKCDLSPARVREFREILPAAKGRNDGFVPRSSTYQLLKRSLDIVVSLAVLLSFAPLMLFVAFLIILDDRRPVFFGHVRQKMGGDDFLCWKFRTMRRNAEMMLSELAELNEADGPQVMIKQDPRVTRIGKFLRASQLDELPQFWNVLRGEMSLVGPRPSPDKENVFCPAWRDARLSVRPGITGLWQVERTRAPGRDFEEWIRFDLDYVHRASLRLDAVILVKTGWQAVGKLIPRSSESA